MAVYAVVVAVVGVQRSRAELIVSARNAAFGVTGFLTLAVIIIEFLLITDHFTFGHPASDNYLD